jgi:hypothetical protein
LICGSGEPDGAPLATVISVPPELPEDVVLDFFLLLPPQAVRTSAASPTTARRLKRERERITRTSR